MGGMDRDDSPPATGDTETSGELGEPGKKALDEERKARRDAERQLREANDRLTRVNQERARDEVATEKGLTGAQAKYLTGDSREELQSNADDMLAAFGSGARSDNSRVPKETLRPGAISEGEADPEPSKVADRIFDRGI